MEKESRAEYFKQRRAERKSFSVLVEKDKLELFEKHLKKENKTKSKWLNERIDEVLRRD